MPSAKSTAAITVTPKPTIPRLIAVLQPIHSLPSRLRIIAVSCVAYLACCCLQRLQNVI